METPEAPIMILVAGVLMIFTSIIVTFVVVLKPGNTIPLSRRRPDVPASASRLTVLTDTAVGAINKRLKGKNNFLITREKLERAGLKAQPADFLLMMGAGALAGSVFGFLLGGLFFAIVLLAVVPAGMLAYLSVLIARRKSKFDEQLPDTLQMLTGSMRAGHSLLRAIDASARESDAPMSEELSRIVNETRIGRDLGESMTEVSIRTGSEDFSWISQAIEIHREVGGDLAEVLDHVGETIRDRNQIRRQVKALSAEGKMSAAVLMGLPVVLFFALILINGQYAKTFTTTVPGFLMLGAAAVMLTAGGFWLSRLIKPKY
ncbi:MULTISPECIES: type II secretion system F family protein [Pseudarthrobacter]|uniref:Tight adherence protein B n=1 Tax=Pseudarthrobacter niigatensis TaxID=369935 RepID=A0AAJ1T218_9MICC|nr:MULTISPECIES: type II secretion system F family protein [Pseudarthrobacter]MDQ0147902.1 tight adherence protein B [Pseudarthrobacter niigatensis]MDQ0268016.1 tight adherence protein B [Pseudarthrobacter niigatensis]NUT69824.1 type II secretion system protein F [Pseudarthrobacter sp. C4D7]